MTISDAENQAIFNKLDQINKTTNETQVTVAVMNERMKTIERDTIANTTAIHGDSGEIPGLLRQMTGVLSRLSLIQWVGATVITIIGGGFVSVFFAKMFN